MNVTRKGHVLELTGEQPEVGTKAPVFSLKNLNKKSTWQIIKVKRF